MNIPPCIRRYAESSDFLCPCQVRLDFSQNGTSRSALLDGWIVRSRAWQGPQLYACVICDDIPPCTLFAYRNDEEARSFASANVIEAGDWAGHADDVIRFILNNPDYPGFVRKYFG